MLTWTLAIIAAAVLACALLWSIAPNVNYAFSTVPLLIASTFTACLMLVGFMAVSMTLTGTSTSNIFIFGLLACFFRAVCLMFTYALDSTVFILEVSETLLRVTDISFFFPIALLGAAVDVIEPSKVYTNVPMYLYTVIVGVALLVLAGWLYRRRKSEMAGRSAPSRRLQHVYRIAFTTPFVLLVFTFVSEDLFGRGGTDIAFYIVMAFIVLSVYFLYELITTKSPKSMLRSAPYLLVLLVIGVLFTSFIGIARNTVLSKTPDADEIESVSISRTGRSAYSEQLDYETMQTQIIEIKDREALELISDSLRFSVDSVRNGTYNTRGYYDTTVNSKNGKKEHKYYLYNIVRIKLKNGQSIGRKIKMTEEDYEKMIVCAQSTDEYMDAYLRIPKPDQIYNVYWGGITQEKIKEIYAIFYDEYRNDLSREEQIRYKQHSGEDFGFILSCQGREGLTPFEFNFVINALVPKTLNAFSETMARYGEQTAYRGGERVSLSRKQYAIELLTRFSRHDLTGDAEYPSAFSVESAAMDVFMYSPDGKQQGVYTWSDGGKQNASNADRTEVAELLLNAIREGRLKTSGGFDDEYIVMINAFYSGSVGGEGQEKKRESFSAELLFFADEETASQLDRYLNSVKNADGKDVIIE